MKTIEQSYEFLNENCVSSEGWQAIEFGNQRFWSMEGNFDVLAQNFYQDSETSFQFWGYDDDGNTVVRCWSKW